MAEKIQSIARAFSILESFRDYPDGASVTQLSKDTDLHKSTVHRILGTLLDLGYIEKDEDNKYLISYKLYDLGNIKLKNTNFIEISHGYMKELSEEVNEVVHLVIKDDIYTVYVDKVEANNSITMASHVGTRNHLIYTSVGKAMLAPLSDNEIKDIWDRTPKVKKTEKTILNFDDFMQNIQEVRNTNIARDAEENEDGIYCIGTALYDSTGNVAGAISITGPTFRMTDKLGTELYEKLLKTSYNISRDLGYVQK